MRMHIKRFIATITSAVVFVLSVSAQQSVDLPGVVINHIPASSGKFLGSPSICIVPNGRYVVSHDYFGPEAGKGKNAITDIFISDDKGNTWKKTASLEGQYWSTLFYHNGALYIFGTRGANGDIVLRKSIDNGESWTTPKDSKSGLIVEGTYHTAPTPVIVHNGRIFKAFEYAIPNVKWGDCFSAMVLSAKEGDNLLDAKSWRCSNIIHSSRKWFNGKFRGWLEGNIVYDKNEKQLLNILRLNSTNKEEHCARVKVSPNGKKITFNTENGFMPFPGGAKKFTIRHDEYTGKYWTLVNPTEPHKLIVHNSRTRNKLALYSSSDLIWWDCHRVIAEHPDVKHHGVQYVDWQFDGDDIVAVIRTAWDDEESGADNYHNSNYILFTRVEDYAKRK